MNKIEIFNKAGNSNRIDLSQSHQRIVLNNEHSQYCEGDVYVNGVLCQYTLQLNNNLVTFFSIDRKDYKKMSWATRQKAENFIPELLIETISNHPNIKQLLKQASYIEKDREIEKLNEEITELEQEIYNKKVSLNKLKVERADLNQEITDLYIEG